jgi:hypothetical protein
VVGAQQIEGLLAVAGHEHGIGDGHTPQQGLVGEVGGIVVDQQGTRKGPALFEHLNR